MKRMLTAILVAAVLLLSGGQGFAAPEVYTYDELTDDVKALAAAYPSLVEYRSVGQSALGREIWAVRIGQGPAAVVLNGAHHASEWVTAPILMQLAREYAGSGAPELEGVALWVVPMVNPDGVTLQQQGLAAFPEEQQPDLLALNGGSTDFALWKANARGVDLNRQYPADWEHIRDNPAAPAFANFRGEQPLEAPEAAAMVAFTRLVDPETVLAYHAAGRVIYWDFHGGSRTLANQLAGLTGYDLVPPEENPSGGGYKDWFIAEYGRPGFTVEVGAYTGAPLTLADLPEELERNRGVMRWAARAGLELWLERNRVAISLQDEPMPAGVLWDGRTYAPAAVAEALGAAAMPEGARQLGGQMYVPLRATAEALGWTVAWQNADMSVHLTR